MKRALQGLLIVVVAAVMGQGPAHAQSADLVLCDRLAADPSDLDKPADVRGVTDIAASDVATAIKFCKKAAGGSRRWPRPRADAHPFGGPGRFRAECAASVAPATT